MEGNRGFENPLIPLIASLAHRRGLSLFAVGGAVRDRILHRGPFNDIDFVYSGGEFDPVAGDLRRHVRFKAIPFRNKGFSTLRLCFKSLILDFQPLSGKTLADDALHRDFTANALYMSLDKGEWTLHDPLDGLDHINAGILKEAAPDSFSRDPLRVLRLFRFAASLGFGYQPETLDLARASVPGLSKVSSERNKDELIKIFTQVSPSLLRDMAKIGVFDALGGFCPAEFPPCGSERYLLNMFLFFKKNGEELRLPDFLKRFRFSRKDQDDVRALLSFAHVSPREVIPLFHKASAPLLDLLSDYCRLTGELEKGDLLDDIRRFGAPLVNGRDAAARFGLSGAELGRCLDRLHILQITRKIREKEALLSLCSDKRKEY